MLSQLVTRLEALFSNVDPPLQITYSKAIPLHELFQSIDEHFAIRLEIDKLKKDLEDKTY